MCFPLLTETRWVYTVVEEEPNNLEAKLALAKCLEELGDPSRALVYIKQGAQTCFNLLKSC